ncbi:hypothetical protein RIF29_47159 [Crotalaria pallida]|uniref:Uncharacterized protein n=1 Tax=Crotalaria pallida TaxID=3830 RepID=A0AAN9HHH9_CROPI
MASYWNEPNSSDRQEKPQDERLPKEEIKDLAPSLILLPFLLNPVIDSAAIESKPIESATAGTVSGVQIAVVGIFSAASSSSY